jgi:outer membrane protein OmpA-like peptidoglycan-associated protein
MLPRLALLPIGLFIIWCFVCQRWYVCHIKQKCEPLITNEQPPAPPVDNRPLVFKWADQTAITRPTFGAFRDSILKGLPDGQLLEIVGLYFKDEAAPAGFTNMGLARAAQVKALLSPPLDAKRIVETSRQVPEPEGVRTNLFESALFNYKKEVKDTVIIEEVENTITIYFPYGKATKTPDPKVDEYLARLANRLKKTDETVQITGHTDDAGTKEFNMGLGTARAKHIKDILVKKGIDANRITIDSKGEDEPIASNSTEEGQRQNRRAVLVLNKK